MKKPTSEAAAVPEGLLSVRSFQKALGIVTEDLVDRNDINNCGKEFDTWVFWQSPDMKESPVYLPQEKYRRMFDIFRRWLSLYNPGACLVAGGFGEVKKPVDEKGIVFNCA